MKHKHILVLGASGATGQLLVQMATDRGHHVTALVRSMENLKDRDGLAVVRGDVLDVNALEPVVQGKDAVLSCLGIRRKTASNPWSTLLSQTDFSQVSARRIVSAMQKHGVTRLIAMSAAGAGDSIHKVDAVSRFLFRNSKLAIRLQDSGRMEDVYAASALDTLVVRPARLVDSDPSDKARNIERCSAASKISRSDVAQWMLDALERPEPFNIPAEMIAWG